MICLTVSGETVRDLEVQFQNFPAVADAVAEWAVHYLRARGHAVSRFGVSETPAGFMARVGISDQTFHRKTRDPRAAALFHAVWGEGKHRARILSIQSTPEFDTFCRDPRSIDLPAAP
jgi:hypothetical protein